MCCRVQSCTERKKMCEKFGWSSFSWKLRKKVEMWRLESSSKVIMLRINTNFCTVHNETTEIIHNDKRKICSWKIFEGRCLDVCVKCLAYNTGRVEEKKSSTFSRQASRCFSGVQARCHFYSDRYASMLTLPKNSRRVLDNIHFPPTEIKMLKNAMFTISSFFVAMFKPSIGWPQAFVLIGSPDMTKTWRVCMRKPVDRS